MPKRKTAKTEERPKFKERFAQHSSGVKIRWWTRLEMLNDTIEYWDKRTQRGKIRHVRRAIERYSALGISNMAATLSYYLIFALFPFVIFLTWFLASFGGNLVSPEMLQYFKNLLPEEIRNFLAGVLRSVGQNTTVAMASIGILALLWSSSRGFSVLVYTMDMIYQNKRNTATYFIQQLISMLITLFSGIALMIAMLSMAFGSYIISIINQLFNIQLFDGNWVNYLNYAISFLFLSVLFSLVYHLCSKRKGAYRYALLCGLGTGLAWVTLTLGFSIYLRSSTRYSLLYGSLTGIIILMLWLYLCSTLLLIIGIIHSEILHIKRGRYSGLKAEKFELLREAKEGPAPIGFCVSVGKVHKSAPPRRQKRR